MVKQLTKAQKEARKQARKERIRVGFRDDDESFINIPRFKMSLEHLNKAFNVEVEYLVDDTGTVVYPDRFLFECMPPPFKYFIMEKEFMDLPPDDAEDPWYIGETQLVAWNVPMNISAEDLDCWLKKGLEESDERFSSLSRKIEDLEKKLAKNQERLDNVPFMSTSSETDKGKAEERRLVTKTLEKEREELSQSLESTKTTFDAELSRRAKKKFKLTQISTDEKRKLSVWHIQLDSDGEARRAVHFQRWTSLKLIPKVNSSAEYREAFATFNEIEDRSLREESVNMRGVVLHRIRHGFGTFTDWGWGDAYRGQFYHGLRHGKGKLHDKLGTFEGEFKDDYRFGNGVQEYSNGDTYTGEFGFNAQYVKEPRIMTHDFKIGVPNGKGGTYAFADGSTYVGEFLDGEITGKGVYHNPNTGEHMEGTFLRGRLHGEGFHVTHRGERLEGSFRDGELHRFGRWESKSMGDKKPSRFRERSSCEGTWFNGQQHGKCIFEDYKGHTYKGYYHSGFRNGPGTLVYGNVSQAFDRSTGKSYLRHDSKYEGTWIADRIRARNVHITVHDRLLPVEKDEKKGEKGYMLELKDELDFTTNFKSWSKYPFLHKIVFREAAKRRRKFIVQGEWERAQSRKMKQVNTGNHLEFKRKRRQAIQLYKKIDRGFLHFREFGELMKAARLENQGNFDDEEEELEYDDGFDEDEIEEEEEEYHEGEEDVHAGNGVYYDSDWDSVGSHDSEPDADFLVKNPQYTDLRISLMDIFEDPPPTDKTGNASIRQVTEHYGVRAREQQLLALKAALKKGIP